MYPKQLASLILRKREKGESLESIREELAQDGWSTYILDHAFHYASTPEIKPPFSLRQLLRSDVKESTLILTIFFLVIIFSGVFYYFRETVVTYEIKSTNEEAPHQVTFTYGAQPSLSNPDFFSKVKNQFIEGNTTFIEINLSEMKVTLYKNGVSFITVPVKTKGKDGSWWETPAGLYKIETKEKTHYSTMGKVTQPWSMQFQGNFFIHGWPQYDDGTPVSSQFSGGCVRLTDEDAKKIFDEALIGTPVLVYEKDFIPDAFVYKEFPDISSYSFMSADILNNHVFFKKNEQEIIPATNLTKLMTALVATEYINIEKSVTVQEESLISTSIPRLKSGMSLSVYQLLFPLLRESSNEAAEAIARSYGRSLFIKRMNDKAIAIGMTNTRFVDPTGNSSLSVTTGEDVFMLAKYIYNNRSFIFNITSGKVKTSTYGESVFKNLGEANELADTPYFFGGISTKDNRNTNLKGQNLAIFEIPIQNTVRTVFFLSQDSPSQAKDITMALNYIKNLYIDNQTISK